MLPRFDLEASLRLIAGAPHAAAPRGAAVVLALAKSPLVDQFDLSSLDARSRARRRSAPTCERGCAARVGCEIVQGYGMTEMSPVSHFTPTRRDGPGRSGLPVPNTECRVVDPETGEDARPGEAGEFWVRGPQVMLGYLNSPEATAATIDADGWLHTGDLGRVDEDGWFFIVDRLKELIKFKGFRWPRRSSRRCC